MAISDEQPRIEVSPDDTDDDTSKRPHRDQLPARRDRPTALMDVPKEGVKLVIERSADIYYSACRRIATFFNDRK